MSNVSMGRSSRRAKRGRAPGDRSRLVVVILMLVFALIMLLAGVASLVGGVQQQQEVAQVAAAPVCTSGQRTGCKQDERVTVTDFHSEEASRSGYISQIVQVRTPDGGTDTVYSHDQDFGLWDRLHVNEQVNAELWAGSIVRLDDGAGHFLLSGDEPGGSYFAAVLLTVLGGVMLIFFVRVLLRIRRTGS